MTMLYNPDRLVAEVVGECLTPPPPVDYLAWAKSNIRFSESESDFPGAYNERHFPYFVEVFKALGPDDPCRVVTLMKSAQIGGTVLATAFALGTMDVDPCPFMFVHPTEDNGDRWSKQKLTPMIRKSARLSAMFPERSRDASNSVRYKERADGAGFIQVAGANSAAGLSQITILRQVQDDLAKWENNSAGDPEEQAESRSKARSDAKIFKISTPLLAPGCRITTAFEAGSQERYQVPCPHCGHLHALEWENMRDHLDLEHPETACFYCPDCGGAIEQKHRAWMVDPANGAHWVAKYPERRSYHRSFQIWMAYSVLESWAAIARAYAKVHAAAEDDSGSQDRRRSIEQTFYNDSLGLPLVINDSAVDWEVLRDRGEENDTGKATVPARALALTLGIDVQETWIEWTLWGWGAFGYRCPIDHGKFDGRTGLQRLDQEEHSGHISEPAIMAALDKLIARKWKDQNGRSRLVDLTAIDGNYSTNDVYKWASRHPRSKVIMVRGDKRPHAPLISPIAAEYTEKGRRRFRKHATRAFNINTHEIRMRIVRCLKKTDPEQPGFTELLRGMGDAFWQGLTAEHRVAKRSAGRLVYAWEVITGRRNEVFDNAVQAYAAAARKGILTWGAEEWEARRVDIEKIEPDEPDLEDLLMAPPKADAPPASKPAQNDTKTLAQRMAELRARRARKS